jgi:FkbM family methyltransferase
VRHIQRDGFRFTVEDERIEEGYDFWTVFENRTWEPELDNILRYYLKPEMDLVDIGAWIGPITLMATSLCRHVWAIEPDPVAARLLRTNIALSNCKQSVTVREVAINDSCSPVALSPTSGGKFGDSMTSIWNTGEILEVAGYTIETLFQQCHIDSACLIKIDVEGAEEKFLPQAKPFLQSLGVPILLSLHTLLAPDKTRYLNTIKGFLEGFDIEGYDTSLVAGSMDVLGVVLISPKRMR